MPSRRATTSPYADALARPALADLPPHRRGRAPARRGRAGARGRRLDDARRRSRTCCCSTGSSSGTTRSSGCSTRPAATGRPTIDVPLPSSLSATVAGPAARRPGRRSPATWPGRCRGQPSPAARFGTRFHAWVEARFGQQVLLDPDELPGRGDAGIDDDADLRELIKLFEDGPFADRVPLRRRAAVRAGARRPGGARPDRRGLRRAATAAFLRRRLEDQPRRRPPTRCSSRSTASPGPSCTACPLERVRAAFYYVRTGELVEPEDLPGRAALEALVTADSS